MACFYVISRTMFYEWRSIRPVEIYQYDIIMDTHYNITMGNVVRDTHCEITMCNIVARDILCDVIMSNDLDMHFPNIFIEFIFRYPVSFITNNKVSYKSGLGISNQD